MSASSQPSRPFFVTGGTLDPDSPSYIERQADQELYESCLAGDYCWVLTTRQMGKSSLMARTSRRLEAEGVATAIVDLSVLSKEKGAVSADQWYYGIAHTVLRDLGIQTKLGEWWRERANLPSVQRLVELFEDVVLPGCEGRVVVFVDELDSTLDLPFADDFFAAVRSCFNRRATHAIFQRLSFVLLGTATPAQLIADPTRTPFNIGREIELKDFTEDEARPLVAGLGTDPEAGERLLCRVLYWTDGHPYLTQALCQAVAEGVYDPGALAEPESVVDGLVKAMFLDETEARSEKNLRFVADRLTAARRNKRRILKTYRKVRRGKRVQDEPRSSVVTALKLSGVVKRERSEELRVRNRVYEWVFSPAWVRKEMPSDWRAMAAAAAAVLSLAWVGFWYFTILPRSYIRTLETASQDEEVAYQAYDGLRRLPFFDARADELLAGFWERRGDRDRALLTRIDALRRSDGEKKRRLIEQIVGNDYVSLRCAYRDPGRVNAALFSASGGQAFIGTDAGNVIAWDTSTCEVERIVIRYPASALSLAVDGSRRLPAAVMADGFLILNYLGRAATIRSQARVKSVAFAPFGNRLVAGDSDGSARVWDAETSDPITAPLPHKGVVRAVAFSPDGRSVLTGSEDHTARLWDAVTGSPVTVPLRHDGAVVALAFGPDGRAVLTGSWDHTARVWNATTGEPVTPPLQHRDGVLVCRPTNSLT